MSRRSLRHLAGSLIAGSILLSSALAAAHPVTVDGEPTEWLTRAPNGPNLGLIARGANGSGEYIWRDATSDTRTDLLTPEVVVDIAAFQVTGNAAGIGFLVRRLVGSLFPGPVFQVQIAIDMDRVAGSGQTYFAEFADTTVAESARWERLVETVFGSGGKAKVIDTGFNKVADVEAAVGSVGDVEIFVPWSALGLNGPPATPLRFTVATFRTAANDVTIDVGGPAISNALDCVSDYGDPTATNHPNTWDEVMDGVVDYNFDLYFDTNGEVYAPLVVQRFLANSSGGGSDEWYAVRNVSPGPITLTNFKIGDEETPDGNEGMFMFPAGATIAAGASYVVARDGAAYQAYFGAAPDAKLSDLTPFTAWTSAATPNLQLADTGDEILLLDRSNTLLDVVVFGDGAYAGVTSLATPPGTDEVATRSATSADTDDCAVDFSNGGKACTMDAQCGGACRQCAGNVCVNKPQGAACPDADPCNGDEVCDGNGACVASTAPACDDQNPCTTDTCAPATGCTHTPLAAGTSCSDGDACNGVEVCDANGMCMGTPLDCADTDPCTIDTCDKITGCQHTAAADGTSCADGDVCNGAEVCMSGACTVGAPLDCDDLNDCTVDTCDTSGGCQHAPKGDGATCAEIDCDGTCMGGACQCNNPTTSSSSSSSSGGTGGGASSSSSSSASSTSSSASSGSGIGGEGGGSGGAGGSGLTDSGCGCRAAGGNDEVPSATWLFGLAAIGAIGRRRRAR
ncbi:BNR repeat domain protein [Minicystis rosea]|nr:BNR repeat domain protein [Minicystis rosea]